MSEENLNYFEIQKYDIDIMSFQKEISLIDEKLKDQMGLDGLKEKLTMIQNKIEEQEKIQRKILISIKENEDSINNINTTIYSGKIRNNKELDALKIEIKTKSEFISNIDPKKELVANNIIKLEGIKENAELKILDTEDKWILEEKKLFEKKKNISEKITILSNQRENISDLLDKRILTLYENFLLKSGNLGIGKLENNKSTCCKIELPNAFIEKVKSSVIPIICNCGKSLVSE